MKAEEAIADMTIAIVTILMIVTVFTSGCLSMNTPFGSGTIQGRGSNVSCTGYAAPGQTLKITAEVGAAPVFTPESPIPTIDIFPEPEELPPEPVEPEPVATPEEEVE